jgi:hypothetical protein
MNGKAGPDKGENVKGEAAKTKARKAGKAKT